MDSGREFYIVIASHPLAEEFNKLHSNEKFTNLQCYIEEFKRFCSQKNTHFNNELWFKMLEEKINSLKSDTIEYCNPNLVVDERDLDSFLLELHLCDTGNRKYTKEQSSIYKSFKEVTLFKEYKCNEFSLNQWMHAVHPSIKTITGRFLINAGDKRGIKCIFDVLKQAVVMPNIYWHTERALIAYVETIWEVLRLCKLSKVTGNELRFLGLPTKIVKLLFIYMSRCIALSPNAKTTPDIYSYRAELFYYYPQIMQVLFMSLGVVIKPDLYFSSDKYMAYITASKVNKNLVKDLYLQCYWDSLKMYRYGSLTNLNPECGYVDVCDEGFLEVVEKCRLHSLSIAQRFYDTDKQGNLYLTRNNIDDLYQYIMESEIDLHKNFKEIKK